MEGSPARTARRWTIRLVLLALVIVAAFAGFGYVQRHPEDVPWTDLDLSRPIGMFTGRKLAALRDKPDRCRGLLSAAGIAHELRPARDNGESCSVRDAVRLPATGARTIALAPPGAEMSCPVAAGLALWEWHVVQPAAARHFSSRVVAVDHLGTYNCRRINWRPESNWSEHATANAIDVAGFRFEDGRRVTVLAGWNGSAAERAFLREVRDGACRLFATVVSPDRDAMHRDHLHLDQAARGSRSWRACR